MVELGIDFNEAKRFLRYMDYTCKPFDKTKKEFVAYPVENSIS